MFRVPIWITSAASSTASASSVSISSVTTPMPVRSRTFLRIASPSRPRPWKAYGLVRGLNAPARSIRTPRASRNSAVWKISFSLSTEHGPATTVNVPGPTVACGNRITVSSRCISRLASLYGLVTRMHSLTPGRTSNTWASTTPVLPVMPMAVRVAPGSGWGVRCCARMAASTRSTCSGVASDCMTTSMGQFLGGLTPPARTVR